MIRALQAALKDIPSDKINRVVIYDANLASDLDGPPALCLSTPAPGVNTPTAVCNVYHAADFAVPGFPNPADFGAPTDTSCAGGDRDRIWCPTSRTDDQSVGVDALGVWVSIDHDMTTGLLPWDSLTITENAIMNLEPDLTP